MWVLGQIWFSRKLSFATTQEGKGALATRSRRVTMPPCRFNGPRSERKVPSRYYARMIRAERDQFVLYANGPDKRFVRVPVDSVAAAHQFGPGEKTRNSILEFWDEHVAPKLK